MSRESLKKPVIGMCIAATGLMLAICVWLTIRQQPALKGLDFSQGKLLETVEDLQGGEVTRQ